MAKLNVTAAYAAYQEELKLSNEMLKKEVLMQHPYYGISDSRGYLTRYPVESQDEEKGALKISAEWLRAFTQAGGQCDSNSWGGHYGVCPYRNTWAEKLDPVQFGRYVSLSGRADGCFGQTYWELENEQHRINRWDYRDDVSYFLSNFVISETCDKRTLARAWRGALIRRIFADNNISHASKSLLTLGHWSQSKVDQIILSQAAPTESVVLRDWAMETGFESYKGTMQDNPALLRLVECGIKYRKRCNYNDYQNRQYLESKKREVQSASAYLLIRKFEGENRLSNSWLRLPEQQFTSIGRIREYADGTLSICSNSDDRGDESKFAEIKYRTQFGYRHFSAVNRRGNTVYFVWAIEEGFGFHVESIVSLADAMDKLKHRKGRKPSDGISLNNVRNDMSGTAGYCFAGTKQFLQVRMPFLYHLVKKYQEWEEVPADIMQTKYYPYSTSLFKGFRNPLIAEEGGE